MSHHGLGLGLGRVLKHLSYQTILTHNRRALKPDSVFSLTMPEGLHMIEQNPLMHQSSSELAPMTMI